MKENSGTDLIPKVQVIDDMYSDSYISFSARKYWYQHYATPEEQKRMDLEDKIQLAVSFTVVGGAALFLLFSFIRSVILGG